MQAGHGSQPDDVGVEWLNAPAAWAFYLGIVATVRFLIGLYPGLRDFQAWTFVNVTHAVITFYIFHWVKGNPFPTYWAASMPSNDRRTWWEQLDHRWQNTPSRKFCTAVVCVLYLFAVQTTPPAFHTYHFINFVAFVVLFIAKLPAMDSVRILGINR
ncbi:unnamed protein product [Chondrus crispus]|uniref:Uncharacterized protein n=1 Tax=Chondrus crispus TaxID=2769 RepID=R7QQ88_CHOCR|nr:unnamed protein product [Chondrus crispus]CDF39646.1 unnamed protein product [Chondrus crispus]|eukprot:XP_005709940.1 unnamed protein product [Chondrus crispus]